MQSAKIIIIGGGAIGLSVAYHFGLRGETDVMLLERHELTSGTSWHAAGIIGPLRAGLAATRLAMYAPQCFRELEAQTGQSTGYQQTGGLWLAQTPERDIEIRRIAALGQSLGFGTRTLTPNELKTEQDWINPAGIRSALWVEEDGQANPVDICMAYAKAARKSGIDIRNGAGVSAIQPVSGQVGSGYQLTLQTGEHSEQIQCEKLIVCAGLWSAALLKPLGIYLPLQAVEHMYVVTDTIDELPNPVPITRDLDAGIYCKGDASKLVLGGFERDAKPLQADMPALQQAYAVFDEDWEQFEPFMQAGIERFPVLAESGVRQFLNGPESFTADTQPLLGPVPGQSGLFVAAGMNSLGIVSSAGVGKSIAEWVLDGLPEWDLLGQDVARFDLQQNTGVFMQQRMREAVASQFETHWPYKQNEFGRGAKRTPVHHLMQSHGAVFGSFAGWERPLWFAEDESESRQQYSYEVQSWWPIVRREAKAIQEGCGLLDLSPFCKFHVRGDSALAYMQRVASREMDLPLGKACYCLMLNHQAGIMADVTVTRLADAHYLVIAAAPCRYRLLDWLQQQKHGHKVQISDETTQEAVFAVVGANSRDLLHGMSGHDFSDAAFPFAAVQRVEIGLVRCRVARLCYVGGLGYELYCPAEYAAYLYEQLCASGQDFGLKPIGMLCVDACRMEQGFVHWGHDIGPNDDAASADMLFAVKRDKPGGFVGRDALESIIAQGVTHKRVVLEVLFEGEPPLVVHDEPVYWGDEVIGHTTSGVLGARSGKVLAMAYLKVSALAVGTMFSMNVAGRREWAVVIHPSTCVNSLTACAQTVLRFPDD